MTIIWIFPKDLIWLMEIFFLLVGLFKWNKWFFMNYSSFYFFRIVSLTLILESDMFKFKCRFELLFFIFILNQYILIFLIWMIFLFFKLHAFLWTISINKIWWIILRHFRFKIYFRFSFLFFLEWKLNLFVHFSEFSCWIFFIRRRFLSLNT